MAFADHKLFDFVQAGVGVAHEEAVVRAGQLDEPAPDRDLVFTLAFISNASSLLPTTWQQLG